MARHINKVRLKAKVCRKCGILRLASDFLKMPLSYTWFEGGLCDTCNPCFQKRRLAANRSGLIKKALKDGVLKKHVSGVDPSCMVCGRHSLNIDGHHEDYHYPMYVVWLCRSCHLRLHKGSNSTANMIKYWSYYIFSGFDLRDINNIDIKYAMFINKYYMYGQDITESSQPMPV
jgi:hypothetical protein